MVRNDFACLSTYAAFYLIDIFLAVYCSPVPQIANGFAVSATNVSFGGMAKYGCYEGFSFPNAKKIEEIFCTDEGRWTITPQCRGIT